MKVLLATLVGLLVLADGIGEAQQPVERPDWCGTCSGLVPAPAPLPLPARAESVSGVITIPVVVHVVWHETWNNISDEKIFSGIDVLNETYRRRNLDLLERPAAHQALAADTEIEFRLATVDPDGNPTTGITRTWTPVTSWSCGSTGMRFTATGGHDAWPRDDYLNVWAVDALSGCTGFVDVLGVHWNPDLDGVILNAGTIGREHGAMYPPTHLGRVLTHEIGHWLRLPHPVPWDKYADGHDFMSNVIYGDYHKYLFAHEQNDIMRTLLSTPLPTGRSSLLSSGGLALPAADEWQRNQAACSMTIDGVWGSEYDPAFTNKRPGELVAFDFASTAPVGSPSAVLLSEVPLVSRSGGAYPWGQQLVTVDLFQPFTELWVQPWPGDYGFSFPAAWIHPQFSLQMYLVDPSAPDGLWLSQGCQLNMGWPPPGPTQDEEIVTVELGPSTGLRPIWHHGTIYDRLYVSSNGRVLLGRTDPPDVPLPDNTPTIPEAETGYPFVGFWTDLDPSAGGSIDITFVPPWSVRVTYDEVPYTGEPLSARCSFSITFDTLECSIYLEGLSGIDSNPMSRFLTDPSWIPHYNQYLGISKGTLCEPIGFPGGWSYNPPATNPGQTPFYAGTSGRSAQPQTDMLYTFGFLIPQEVGADRVEFRIAGDSGAEAGYDWYSY